MSGTTSGVQCTSSDTGTDMTVFRGKSLSFEIVWGGPTPIDVTGYTASLQVRSYSGRVLMELSSANGRVANGGATGRFMFTAPPSVTRAVDTHGTYEVELTTASGQVYRVISGNAAIEEEIVP
jgi:hypothetical protein